MSFKTSGKMEIMSIFVNLDRCDGLFAKLNIFYRGYKHRKQTYYEGIHLRCHGCHK